MTKAGFRQYFGPSPQHPRACVELSFPIGAEPYRLTPFEPALVDAGFKLRETLPDDPLPLDAAVVQLASAMLARHARWWNSHGADGDRGWAAIGHPYPHVAAGALEGAYRLLLGHAPGKRLRELADWMTAVSKIKMWMLFAAETCGHDATIVNEPADVHQVGQGAQGVHMCRAGSQHDGLTSVRLESNKQLTVDTLRKLGLPTTSGTAVHTAAQAVEAARTLGMPCVVKPLNLSRGTGVAAGLADEASVEEAAAAALALSAGPIRVERHVEGDAHRLLVAAGELLWVYRKRASRVTGDGEASIAALIDRENDRRARNRGQAEAHLVKIETNEPLRRYVRQQHGLGLDDILAKGRTIAISGQANTASGGTLDDMMAVTHPDNRALAIRAGRLFRFNVMGIDFITPDISRSWKEVPCAIIEVNRMPSMNAAGDATLVQRTLFPDRLSGAIPMAAVVGSEPYREAMAEALGGAFARQGLRLTTAHYTGQRAPTGGLTRTPAPARIETLVLDPEADAGLVLCDPARAEHDGFPLHRCDVLLREDTTPLPWLDSLAETVMRGQPTQARIDLAVTRLARRYADRAKGGPLPVLEPVDAPPGEFRLKVWRSRGMPRAWFRGELGIDGGSAKGLTTHVDLIEAVRALAPGVPGAFAYDDIVGGWIHVALEASIALPKARRDEARAALIAAVERVNAVAAQKIP